MPPSRAVAALAAAVLLASCGTEPPTHPAAPQQSGSTASTLAVTINGPSRIKTGETCTWTADATGGTAPYRYEWTSPDFSDSQSISTGFFTPGFKQFTVTVTDANWEQAEATTYVSVGSTSGC